VIVDWLLFLFATVVGFFCFFAGIRVVLACFKRRPCAGRHLLLVVRDAGLLAGVFAGIRATMFAIHALPLCGAAPTFLCRRKEK
jgi:hypothetical protein